MTSDSSTQLSDETPNYIAAKRALAEALAAMQKRPRHRRHRQGDGIRLLATRANEQVPEANAIEVPPRVPSVVLLTCEGQRRRRRSRSTGSSPDERQVRSSGAPRSRWQHQHHDLSPTSPSRSGAARRTHFGASATGACSEGNSGRGRPSGCSIRRLPANSPWAGDLVGLEPPLGFSVDAMEPTGEPHEVAASLAADPVSVAEDRGRRRVLWLLPLPIRTRSCAAASKDRKKKWIWDRLYWRIA